MGFVEPDEVGGTRINPKDVVGHLLLVWATDYVADSPTQFSRPDKPSDVIVVDVVDLDQVDENGTPGLLARKTWWRQAQLIGSLKTRIGLQDAMLVRMARGGASMGRNAPYVLQSATADPQAVQRANNWFAANPGFTPSPRKAPPGVEQLTEPAATGAASATETLLEQMARQAQNLPPAKPQPDSPPF